MTDPMTRAQAALYRAYEHEKTTNPWLQLLTVYLKEVAQEIEQAVLVERDRCTALVRRHIPISPMEDIEKHELLGNIANEITLGVEPDD
jgi:hypothetical protein